MFRRPTPQAGPGGGKPQAPVYATNMFENGTFMDLYVYVSESADGPDFSRPEQLAWRQLGLQYGDWTSGPDGNGIFSHKLIYRPSEAVLNNGSVYLHVFVVREGRSPDPSTGRLYSRQETISGTKRLNKFKRKVYRRTQNLLTGSSEISEEDLKVGGHLRGAVHASRAGGAGPLKGRRSGRKESELVSVASSRAATMDDRLHTDRDIAARRKSVVADGPTQGWTVDSFGAAASSAYELAEARAAVFDAHNRKPSSSKGSTSFSKGSKPEPAAPPGRGPPATLLPPGGDVRNLGGGSAPRSAVIGHPPTVLTRSGGRRRAGGKKPSGDIPTMPTIVGRPSAVPSRTDGVGKPSGDIGTKCTAVGRSFTAPPRGGDGRKLRGIIGTMFTAAGRPSTAPPRGGGGRKLRGVIGTMFTAVGQPSTGLPLRVVVPPGASVWKSRVYVTDGRGR
ncbi:uncharacterized protein LOC119110915 [Pollicipes pollicipes]|uniref:uncharacterized protein LOC119110915 n=1 Tax=Pollicipes pollicipes TaxID=41117 RepID=UPI001885529B|nr:uncharacterized protein LOC119110915 [Pollicipes pollicipes]